jgi:hypothetical protein
VSFGSVVLELSAFEQGDLHADTRAAPAAGRPPRKCCSRWRPTASCTRPSARPPSPSRSIDPARIRRHVQARSAHRPVGKVPLAQSTSPSRAHRRSSHIAIPIWPTRHDLHAICEPIPRTAPVDRRPPSAPQPSAYSFETPPPSCSLPPPNRPLHPAQRGPPNPKRPQRLWQIQPLHLAPLPQPHAILQQRQDQARNRRCGAVKRVCER